MAVYVAITKIFEDNNKCIYELSNGYEKIYCYAVISFADKQIHFYKDLDLKNLLYTYTVFNQFEDGNKPIPMDLEDVVIWGRSLSKLIPAVREGIFPQYLDKCS